VKYHENLSRPTIRPLRHHPNEIQRNTRSLLGRIPSSWHEEKRL